MFKKIGVLLIIVFAFVYLYLNVSIKVNSLTAPLREILNENSLKDVTFDGIKFKFFNRISVSGVTLKDSLYCGEITFSIDPILLIKNIHNPGKALYAVNIDGGRIVWDETLKNFIGKISFGPGASPFRIKNISFRNCGLKYSAYELAKVRGSIQLGKVSDGKIYGRFQGNKFRIDAKVRQSKEKYNGEVSFGITGRELDVSILSAFSGVAGKGVLANVRIPRFNWQNFSLNDSTAKIRYAGGEFLFRFFSRAGKGELALSNGTDMRLSLDLVLGSMIRDVSGKLNCLFEKAGDSVNGYLYLTNLYYKKDFLGNSLFDIKTKNKSITGTGTVVPAGYKFELAARPGKVYSIKGKSKDRNASLDIWGNTAPFDARIKISKWPLKEMPLLSTLYPGLQGRLNFEGKAGDGKMEINGAADNCSFKDSGPVSFSTHILATKAGIFYNLDSSDKSVRLSGKILNTGFWDVGGLFEKASLDKYSGWALLPVQTRGSLSGSFYIDSGKNGYLKADVQKLAVSDYMFDSAKISANFDPDTADINYFSLHAGKGTLAGNISIGLNPYWGSSSLGVTFFKFPFKNNIIDGKLAVKGNIFSDNKLRFTGGIEGEGLSFGSWKTKTLKGVLDLSKDDVQIKNLAMDNCLNGDINLVFAKKAVSGLFDLNNFPLSNLSPDADGLINGNLSILKTLDDPEITLSYSTLGARYKKYGFSSSAKLTYKNKNLSGNKIFVSSGTSNIILEGNIWPELRLRGKVDYISISLIQNLIEREIPISGGFGGRVSISDSLENPKIAADIRAIGLYYNEIAIPQFVGSFSFKDGNLNIEKFYTKFEDSELFLSGGSYVSLKDNKFKIKSELRNCHAGPVCVFGKLNLEGEFYQKGNKYGAKGMAETQGFWVNQRNLTRTRVGFDVFGNSVSFGKYLKYPSIADGKIDFGKWPKVQFYNFKLSEGGSYFKIDGSVAPKWSEFSVHTMKLSGEILTDLAQLPINIQGMIDSSLAFRGTVDKPSIAGNIKVSSGSIAEMPFGRMELNFREKDDLLKIFDSGIALKDKKNITLEGTVPFFLTPAAKKRVQRKKIDLTLAVEKESLMGLNGLTQDFTFVKGGLEARLNLSGSVLKPTWNGSVKISGGEMDSKQYVKKVKDMNVDISLKNNILKINECSGKVGSGKARVTGTVVLEGFMPQKFNVHFVTEGHGVAVTIPQLPIPTPLVKTNEESVFSNLSHGEPKADLKLYGTMKNLTLSGWIELENTRFTYPSILKSEPSESVMDAVWPLLNLNVEFRSAKNTWYDNELASVNVGGNIKLTGKADNIIVNGRIEGLRGEIQYFGADFEVKSCLLEIIDNQVYLQAEATSEVYVSNEAIPDVITMTVDRAEISKIKPHFSSRDNSNLSSEKALARATRMDPTLYEGQDENFMMQKQFIRMIDSSLTTPIARNILKKSGLVDTFNVNYVEKSEATAAAPGAQPSLTDLLYGTKYSVQKYLTNQVQLGYSLIFDRLAGVEDRLALRHEVDLSYKWTKNIFVTGSYQLDNQDLATQPEKKVMVNEVFKFGGPKKKKKETKKPEQSQADKALTEKVKEESK